MNATHTDIKLLDASQTEAFDTEYVDDDLFLRVQKAIRKNVEIDNFHFLDVGGGNGRYADRVLQAFPFSKVDVIEPDIGLVQKNSNHSRKRVMNRTYQEIADQGGAQYDVIGFNWVLHHFVGYGYKKTLQLQIDALQKAMTLLKPGGIILVFENFYEGINRHHCDAPGRRIYQLTSSRVLKSITRYLGANTAGVGVCFHSQAAWEYIFKQAGTNVVSSDFCYRFGDLSSIKKWLLGIREQNVGMMIGQNS